MRGPHQPYTETALTSALVGRCYWHRAELRLTLPRGLVREMNESGLLGYGCQGVPLRLEVSGHVGQEFGGVSPESGGGVE
jgi:hypothetical protein